MLMQQRMKLFYLIVVVVVAGGLDKMPRGNFLASWDMKLVELWRVLERE